MKSFVTDSPEINLSGFLLRAERGKLSSFGLQNVDGVTSALPHILILVAHRMIIPALDEDLQQVTGSRSLPGDAKLPRALEVLFLARSRILPAVAHNEVADPGTVFSVRGG
jgi:hypothetical protein